MSYISQSRMSHPVSSLKPRQSTSHLTNDKEYQHETTQNCVLVTPQMHDRHYEVKHEPHCHKNHHESEKCEDKHEDKCEDKCVEVAEKSSKKLSTGKKVGAFLIGFIVAAVITYIVIYYFSPAWAIKEDTQEFNWVTVSACVIIVGLLVGLIVLAIVHAKYSN